MNLPSDQAVSIVAAIASDGIRTHKASQPLGPKPSAFTGFATDARGDNRGWHESNRWRASATRPLPGTLSPTFFSFLSRSECLPCPRNRNASAGQKRSGSPSPARGERTSKPLSPRNVPRLAGRNTRRPSNKKTPRPEHRIEALRLPQFFCVARLYASHPWLISVSSSPVVTQDDSGSGSAKGAPHFRHDGAVRQWRNCVKYIGPTEYPV